MKPSIKLLTIKGITVYLHFTLLFFVVWLAIMYVASGMQLLQLGWSMLFIVAIFASILLHEYGHALVASFFGINAKKITLYPIGGIASIERLPENPRQELLISIAGPVVSLCIGALLLLFSPQRIIIQAFTEFSGHLNGQNILFILGIVNISLAFFNLLPAFPLDGGRILRALLAFKYNYIKATSIAALIGKVIATVIVIVGLFSFNLMLAIVGLFIIFFAKAEESYLQLRTLVKDVHLKDALMFDYDSIEGALTVNEAADILENNHAEHFIVMFEGTPIGTLNRMDVVKAVAEQDYNKKIFDLMKEDLVPLQADTLVEDVLDELAQNEKRIYTVFDKDLFVGVVNFQHIIEYMLIHQASKKDYNKAKSLVELI